MHNSKYQCHMAACCTYHRQTCLLLTAKQESAYLLMKSIGRIFWKKFRRKGQQAENDKTERVTGLGRRTREEIAKWNQMTALRFQTGGRHQTSPASLRGLPKGFMTWTRNAINIGWIFCYFQGPYYPIKKTDNTNWCYMLSWTETKIWKSTCAKIQWQQYVMFNDFFFLSSSKDLV